MALGKWCLIIESWTNIKSQNSACPGNVFLQSQLEANKQIFYSWLITENSWMQISKQNQTLPLFWSQITLQALVPQQVVTPGTCTDSLKSQWNISPETLEEKQHSFFYWATNWHLLWSNTYIRQTPLKKRLHIWSLKAKPRNYEACLPFLKRCTFSLELQRCQE